MKFRTTIILFAIFAVLLAFVLLFEFKGKSEKKIEEKLVNLSSDDVQKITFQREDGTISFKKDEKGEWFITEPLQAKADNYEVNRLTGDFSDIKIERVVEEVPKDISKYNIPQKEITLWYKGKDQPVKILVGMENPLDNTLFTKRADEQRVVLIPSHLKNLLEKNVLDFRQKDIFKFETDRVSSIKLRAKDISWEAEKKEDNWFFKHPVKALAEKSKITALLSSLSNLKAKDFISEEKNQDELKKHGFEDAEYEITLSMPVTSKEVKFSLHKREENLYATTSLSPKIISVEDSVLADLKKKAEELREKEVLDFYSWEASKLHLKKENLEITVLKGKEDTWHFESPEKHEADGDKIKDFMRKIESLEAVEFIDPPFTLKDYGLDKPRAEITVWTKEDDSEKSNEFKVLVGSEDKEAKNVIVKNTKLDYLFKVSSDFLESIPKEIKDWKVEKEEEK